MRSRSPRRPRPSSHVGLSLLKAIIKKRQFGQTSYAAPFPSHCLISLAGFGGDLGLNQSYAPRGMAAARYFLDHAIKPTALGGIIWLGVDCRLALWPRTSAAPRGGHCGAGCGGVTAATGRGSTGRTAAFGWAF